MTLMVCPYLLILLIATMKHHRGIGGDIAFGNKGNDVLVGGPGKDFGTDTLWGEKS